MYFWGHLGKGYCPPPLSSWYAYVESCILATIARESRHPRIRAPSDPYFSRRLLFMNTSYVTARNKCRRRSQHATFIRFLSFTPDYANKSIRLSASSHVIPPALSHRLQCLWVVCGLVTPWALRVAITTRAVRLHLAVSNFMFL